MEMEPPSTIDMEDLPFIVFYQCRMCTQLVFDDIEKMFLHFDERHGAMIDCDELKTMIYTNGLRLGSSNCKQTYEEYHNYTNHSSNSSTKSECLSKTKSIYDEEGENQGEIENFIHQNGDEDVLLQNNETEVEQNDFMDNSMIMQEEDSEAVEESGEIKYDLSYHDEDDEQQLDEEEDWNKIDDATTAEHDQLEDGTQLNDEYDEEEESSPGFDYGGEYEEEEYADESSYTAQYLNGDEEEEEDMENLEYSTDTNTHENKVLNYGYSCKFCGKFFTTQRGVESHEQHHKTSQARPTLRPNPKRFPCKICKTKTFTCFKDLKQHVKSHTTDRIHICKFCFSTFNNTASLTKHLTIHTTENPNKCFCGKTFVSANTLKIHKKIHTGIKPFVCKFYGCGRAFVTKSTLESHLRTHTGEKPYQCGYCQSSFTTSSAKYRHERHVHKVHDHDDSILA